MKLPLRRPRFISSRNTEIEVAIKTDTHRFSAGLEPYSGPWTQLQAIHLQRRTGFGAKREDTDLLLDMSIEDAVNLILYNTGNPLSEPLNNYTAYLEEPDPDVAPGETWINAPYTENGDLGAMRLFSMKIWWLNRMLHQPLCLEEKMILFWSNHLVTQASEVFEARLWYRHWMKLRQYALGNFKEMVKIITKDPQMLIYLNGYFNEAGAPDENYARELMELFTLGQGTGYTEDDVQEAARILTGYKINFDTLEPYFESNVHDSEDKHFSAYFDNAIIAGLPGAEGENELDSLLEIIFTREETARFLCRKLYRFFVYHQIDENTEENIIIPLADILRTNNYEILPVLDTLFKSVHFYDAANLGSMLKSPLDFMIGMFRDLAIAFPPDEASDEHFASGITLWYLLTGLNQDPGDPPNVAGWPAYYQVPQYDKNWINTDTLPRRGFYSEVITSFGFYPTDTLRLFLDYYPFLQSIPQAQDPDELITYLTKWLMPLPINDESKYLLKNILLSGQIGDYYWTDACQAYLDDPTNEDNYNTLFYRIAPFMKVLLQLEEYQLM